MTRATSLSGLQSRLISVYRRLKQRGAGASAVDAEYLLLIYRNLIFSSPVALVWVIYLSLQVDFRKIPQFRWWLMSYGVYLGFRWLVSVAYSRQSEHALRHLRWWSALSVLIQGCGGVLLAVLGLFVMPLLEPLVQMVGTMVVLVLVGAMAFSLSGRWIDTLVFAPPVYLSFAWTIYHQDHAYAHGVSLLTLALFALHLVYANNHRKSILEGFSVARRSADLAGELQLKNTEFQEVASARSRLLATVSHDLRQPAHAIGLLSERALTDNSFGSVKETLRDLNELSQSLSASLTTLMDLTRLDAGLVQPHIGPISLGQMLSRLEAEFGASARTKGLDLVVDRSLWWVQSDPVLLHGVLTNLVSNAIKYTRQGRVSVQVVEEGGAALVRVIDSGVGIHADKLDLIFKEFVRLDASDAGTEGLGLGLSIVRRYASLLSHPLSVQSQPGVGSSFSVFLQRVDAPAQALELGTTLPVEAVDDEALRGLKVLVIDNVELLLASMSKTLSGWGCQVRAAHNMAAALQSASQEWPDLLVSDHHLGDREPNGIELIQGLRRQAELTGRQHLPALLMTGDVSAQLEAQAREVGVRILHKPVRPKVLRTTLIDLMSRSAVREPQV